MRYLSIYLTAERNGPPSSEEIARMGELIDEGFTQGWLVSTEGCLPSALGARVRRAGEAVTVTDGPFTEAKEVVGGFAILEAQSKAHALELTRRFLAVAGDGVCELRQLYEPGAGGAQDCAGASAEAAAVAPA